MKKIKNISKKEHKKAPTNYIGEANIIEGDFWLVEEEEETFQEAVIRLLTEIRDK